MTENMFLVLHDNGTEYYNDDVGIPVALFPTETDAILFIFDNRFGRRDSNGNFWRGTDRAWIKELNVFELKDLDIWGTIDTSGGASHDVSTWSARDTD